jgi:hypothetical protein
MSVPLFGPTPLATAPSEVFQNCVSDYDASLTRPYIWDGIKHLVENTCSQHPDKGTLHVDSEFVEITQDPTHAALVLESAHLTRELNDLWNGKDNREHWMVETYLLGPRPADPETLAAWETLREEILNDLSAYGTKGYPILDLHTCHNYTKS